jgi:phosphoribosyl-AMP cyclohydrolase
MNRLSEKHGQSRRFPSESQQKNIILSALIKERTMAEKTRVSNELEEGTTLQLDFTKLAQIASKGCDVLPVAVQDADTKEVILVAYANQQALQVSLETRIATFWSTSRNELWIKGKTSGDEFDVVAIYVNCEQNSLLYQVRPRKGGICHTKNRRGASRNCYYRRINFETRQLEHLDP